jgi:GAF domain-containing protein
MSVWGAIPVDHASNPGAFRKRSRAVPRLPEAAMSQTDHARPPRADEALERFSRLALREQPMPDLLEQLVELTASVMPAGSETAVSLDVEGALIGTATGARARRLDAAQFADGGGPGVHAARTGVIIEVSDTRTEQRWPEHGRRAVDAGVLSTLSIPVSVDASAVGALTVFAPEANAFDDALRWTARRVTPHARSAVAGVLDRDRARAMADELEDELEARAIIARARALLVERHQVTPERAYELMARMSARSRLGLREVAAGVIRQCGGRP